MRNFQAKNVMEMTNLARWRMDRTSFGKKN